MPATGWTVPVVSENVSICGSLLSREEIQLRWLQTSTSPLARLDVWALASVKAVVVQEDETTRLLFEERFGSENLK